MVAFAAYAKLTKAKLCMPPSRKGASVTNSTTELPEAQLREKTQAERDYEQYYSDLSYDWTAEAEAQWAEQQSADARHAKEELVRKKHFARLETCDKQLANSVVRYPTHEYLVDGLFPTGEVHVLSGESCVGKTSW